MSRQPMGEASTSRQAANSENAGRNLDLGGHAPGLG